MSKEAEWVAETRASTGIDGGLDAEKAESLADAGAREQERELQHLRAAPEQGARSRPVIGKRQVAKVSLRNSARAWVATRVIYAKVII